MDLYSRGSDDPTVVLEAGLVLVDSSHEDQEKRLPQGPWNNQVKLLRKPELMRFASI